MADDTVQVIQDARVDARTLSTYINTTNQSAMVTRRLAPPIHPIQYWENYFQTLADTGTTTQLQNVEIDVNRETADKYTPKNILFVGDSLTEPHTDAAYTTPRDTYAQIISDVVASTSGGYKELSYISLSTQNSKDLKSQVSITRIGFTDMWGASDHKWNQTPFNYSPDGHGFWSDSTSTTDYIYVNTVGNIAATKLRLFYLKQPNGGKVQFGYSTTAAANRLLVDTSSTEYGIGVVEIDSSTLSERIIISSNEAGKKLAFYGLQFVDDNTTSGVIANNFSRSGSMLQEHNQLQAMPTYYANINPDTVFLNIGTNDALIDTSRISAAQFEAEMVIWMDRLRATCPDARVYIVEPNRSSIYGTDAAGDGEGLLLEAYTQVRKDIASAYDNTVYVDVPKIAGDYNYFVTSDFMADALHPNAYGKYHIARKIMQFMSLSSAPLTPYKTLTKVTSSTFNLTPKSNSQTIAATYVPIAKYGLSVQGTNAYFDIKVTATFSGRMWAGTLKFYAIKTVQAGNEILDIRGVVSSVDFRYDATSSTSNIELTSVKAADGTIEVQVKLTGSATPTANEWSLRGTVMSSSKDYLVEL